MLSSDFMLAAKILIAFVFLTMLCEDIRCKAESNLWIELSSCGYCIGASGIFFMIIALFFSV